MVGTSNGEAETSGCWTVGQNGAGVGRRAQLKGAGFQQSLGRVPAYGECPKLSSQQHSGEGDFR